MAKIAELDLELSEGDITQKGYEKKKNKLLAPFLRENQPSTRHVSRKLLGHCRPQRGLPLDLLLCLAVHTAHRNSRDIIEDFCLISCRT